MKYEDFCRKCFEGTDKDEMFPNGTNAQEGLEILVKHFLGYTPIVNYSCGATQWNSEAIGDVLRKYPEGTWHKVPYSEERTKKEKFIDGVLPYIVGAILGLIVCWMFGVF